MPRTQQNHCRYENLAHITGVRLFERVMPVADESPTGYSELLMLDNRIPNFMYL
jgi:hypothetical protein